MNKLLRSLNAQLASLLALFNSPATCVSPHCTNINMLLMHLCDFDANHYSYVLQWLAYPLRNPGAKMRYGLVINGGGARTGMSLFFQRVAVPLHVNRGRIISPCQLDDTFNSRWAGAPLLVVDGSITSRAAATVKTLMSSQSMLIHEKYQEPREVSNQMNFVFLSDSISSRPRNVADRRFLVIDAPPAREKAFYQAVAAEIDNGGVDAFRDYLMHGIDLGGFNESTMPPGLNRSGSNGARMPAVHADREAA